MLRFTKDHEWIAVADGVATIGITDHAQSALGDIVFVELPAVGREVEPGESVAVVESVKAASDVYAPVAGQIVEANQAIVDQPGLVNLEAEKGAWFFKVRLADPSALDELMDDDAYKTFLETLR